VPSHADDKAHHADNVTDLYISHVRKRHLQNGFTLNRPCAPRLTHGSELTTSRINAKNPAVADAIPGAEMFLTNDPALIH
jgi:hypothetical protein